MTEIALIGSALMLVLALARIKPRHSGPRHLVYWWVMTAFGLQVVDLLLVATNVIAYDNQTLGIAFAVPELVIVVLLVSRAAANRARLSVGALLCVTPVVVSLAFIFAGYSWITPMLSIVSIFVAVVLPDDGYPIGDIIDGLTHSLKATAWMILALAAAHVPGLIGQCRMDKCSLWGEQIGGGGIANGFGVGIAIIGPLVALRLSWPRAIVVLIASGLLVDLASSRSALFTMGFGIVVIGSERLLRTLALRIARIAMPLGAVVCICAIAFYPWPPDDFTQRANLWIHARVLIAQRPFLGWGTSFWVRQPSSTLVDANYAAHNLLLEMAVSFGVCGVVVIICGVVAARWHLPTVALPLWSTVIVLWLSGGAIEVVAGPGRTYLLEATFILPLLLVGAVEGKVRPEAADGPRRRGWLDLALHGPIGRSAESLAIGPKTVHIERSHHSL